VLEVRRNHGKSDRQSQRRKQRAADPHEEERRNENSENAQHREEARLHDLVHRVNHGAPSLFATRQMHVNVLDGNCRLIDEYPDGECEPA
jgi:hypothetical protein